MSLQCSSSKQSGVLVIHTSGLMDAAWVPQSEAVFREHLEQCSRERLSGLIFDVRDVEVRMEMVDRYDLGKSLARAQNGAVRIVVLARPEQVSPERFFEQVTVNRGVPLRVLDEEVEAFAWLTAGRS